MLRSKWWLICGVIFAFHSVAKDYPDFTELADKQGVAVVNISITQTVRNGPMGNLQGFPDDDRMREFFRQFGFSFPSPSDESEPEYRTQSLGSGFIISGDGYVLTNAHVVSEADEILVRLADKREFKAKLIGIDKRTDIALLKLNANNLPKVTIGDPNKLKVGEWVAAIGSPFGLENTMTVGIVSAKARSLPRENFVPFIQTDAAVNPGNSGGPLFNLEGEVVGINSQIYSRTGGSVGLSFAIPIDVAIDVSNQLKANGRIIRGWLGIGIQEMTKDLTESFGMKSPIGALVANVEVNSPADKGGIEAGDIVLKFDGKTIATSNDLPKIVSATKPGRLVKLEVLRRGKMKTLTVGVGELPSDDGNDALPNNSKEMTPNKLGLSVRNLPNGHKNKLGRGGVMVTGVQGVASQAGILRGDVILEINSNDIQNVAQFNKVVSTLSPRKPIAFFIQRGDITLYLSLRLPFDSGAK